MNKHQDNNPWKTLSSRVAYSNDPYLRVREDKVVKPDGSEGVYSVIESKPGVLVIAQTPDEAIYLIQSFRYPLQEWRWELPGGGIDSGATPLESAQKELEEELGMRADTWDELGLIYPSENGAMTDRVRTYLARELHTGTRHLEGGEAIRPPKAFPLEEVLSMVARGELTDGQTLSTLLHYQLWLDKR